MTSVIERKTRGQSALPAAAGGAGPHGAVAEHDLRAAGASALSPPGLAGIGRAVGWIEAEVDEWMRERIAASRSDAE